MYLIARGQTSVRSHSQVHAFSVPNVIHNTDNLKRQHVLPAKSTNYLLKVNTKQAESFVKLSITQFSFQIILTNTVSEIQTT